MLSKTKLDHWCEGVIEAGWLAALIVAPMFFNVFSSRVFEPDKISLVRTTALLMLVAWLVKVANSSQLWLPAYGAVSNSGNDDPLDRLSIGQRLLKIPFLLPILLLIMAYGISTIFSVARFVSWWGSYQRLQGTYSFLSYVIIALLTIAHLRTPGQLRRLQHVIIAVSVPISIYGIIQHYAIDPLPWGGNTTTRVAANAGNAIFLSAYLIMAFFFTLERIYSSFAHLLGKSDIDENVGDRNEVATALAGGAYLFASLVQLLAIFWTQSRGPWLGLFLGIYLFVLLLFSALRLRHYRIWVSAWVGVGIAGIGLLVAMNTLSYFDSWSSNPYLGRFTTILDQDSNTAQVRILIWQGAEGLLTPHDPLIFPDETQDGVNLIRPLIGYGPEAMWVAYNPFYPPRLAHHEARNASPDRAHNESWDALVITGWLGFAAYIFLFTAIFYWGLRWLGLLVNRRDAILFLSLLTIFSAALAIVFYLYDGSWRYFGVAMPAGMMAGLVLYVMIASFFHPEYRPSPADIPRQLLIIAIIATIAGHFVEIHFGIAIAATRTYFWIQTALLLVIGMRWAKPEPFAATQVIETMEGSEINAAMTADAAPARDRKRRRINKGDSGRSSKVRPNENELPSLPSMIMTDLLIFLTFVFIYTTNNRGVQSTWEILTNSITKRTQGGNLIDSPALLYLMIFTWLICATIGLATAALRQRRAPDIGWWLRGYMMHALVVLVGWLFYGLIQAQRMIPGIAGNDLDSQLGHVANHFAIYTTIMLLWALGAALVYAWPWLRQRAMRPANHLLASFCAAVILAGILTYIVNTVNVGLVRADIIYKQGQQFDSQRNWISSIELYRRALEARDTEDHYMLFLGRGLLEQAKIAQPEGTVMLGNANLNRVLQLEPNEINQMSKVELLKAADVVLKEAQRVNPLNTDHTANLARLYRTWADMTGDDPDERQALLDQSTAYYETAITLSPNAAHLWNERSNAYLAQGDREEAERSYLHSLSIDPLYDQSYLLLADFYDKGQEYDKAIALLQEGIEKLSASPRHRPNAQFYSYLGVMLSRTGDQQGAIDANLSVLESMPSNMGAMRNLSILYRDNGELDQAIDWATQALTATNSSQTAELKQLHQLLLELYTRTENNDAILAQYEALHVIDANDVNVLKNLNNLYVQKQDWNNVVQILQKLMLLEPTVYQHPLAVAQILSQANQPANALPFAQKALELAPDDQKATIQQLLTTLSDS